MPLVTVKGVKQIKAGDWGISGTAIRPTRRKGLPGEWRLFAYVPDG
jgi:hypothetical protein